MLVPCAAPYVRVLCSLCAPPLALPTPACAAYQVICERALVGSYLGPHADYAEMLEMAALLAGLQAGLPAVSFWAA